MKVKTLSCLALWSLTLGLKAQDLPLEMHFSPSDHRLITGDRVSSGLFDESQIRRIDLLFEQSNYWQLMLNNYEDKIDIPATMIVDGDTFPNVGVRFKGQTSFSQAGNSQKKSFNISLDYADEDQQIMGYKTLNLNNCFDDESFIREVFYLNMIRRHTPAAKGAFVHLYINGQDWGLYPNVQQLDGDFISEWFLNNDGTRWRAEKVGGFGGGGGSGPFNAGKSTLNYLGADTSLYVPNYTLKKAKKENPWQDLVLACEALNTPAQFIANDSLKKLLDYDRALWFVAQEIIFGDDDGYVNKGGMDYYVYWDEATGRLVPHEYDGNSVMKNSTLTWSPFFKENDSKFPIMNKLVKVPEMRQRYLAHLRTILEEDLDSAFYSNKIATYYELIDALVQADPKKLYTYTQFQNQKTYLTNFLKNRRTNLLAHTEIKRPSVQIDEVTYAANAEAFSDPVSGQEVKVTARLSALEVSKAFLYFSAGLDGYFDKVAMTDDGQGADATAGDGIYSAAIKGFPAQTYVRFYVEAIANDGNGTASYMPKGAEHDVYIYQVQSMVVVSPVAINEFMASNSTTVADQDGEYDDWIELFNNSDVAVDLSGWFLSDNENPQKWTFPAGTTIGAKDFLIIWADENGTQDGLHASFKLSAGGETLTLSNAEGNQVDYVEFGEQLTDKGYARVPNGTGPFVIQDPTFNSNNEPTSGTEEDALTGFSLYPNPASGNVYIEGLPAAKKLQVQVFNAMGQGLRSQTLQGQGRLDVSGLSAGLYIVVIEGQSRKLILR